MSTAEILIIHGIAAFFATLAFAVIFNVPRKELILCGLCGMLSQSIYEGLNLASADMLICFFAASAAVTWLSRWLAIRRCKPVTVYLISGIIPLVPGAGFYYTIYEMIAHNNSASANAAVDTFKAAGAISVAIMIVLALPPQLCGKKWERTCKNQKHQK